MKKNYVLLGSLGLSMLPGAVSFPGIVLCLAAVSAVQAIYLKPLSKEDGGYPRVLIRVIGDTPDEEESPSPYFRVHTGCANFFPPEAPQNSAFDYLPLNSLFPKDL